MSTVIRAKGVFAEDFATSYASPVSRGLEAIHFTNTNSDKIARNYASGKANGSLMGTPTSIAAGSTRFKAGTNGLITSVQEPEQATIFVIAKSPVNLGTIPIPLADRPAFWGTFQSPLASNPGTTAQGIALYVTSQGGLAANVLVDQGGTPTWVPSAFTAAESAPMINVWQLYSVTVGASDAVVALRNETTGQAAPTSPAGTRLLTTGRIRVGTLVTDTTHQGLADIAVAQIHSVVLTDAERMAVVADLRAYAARKGITV